MHKRPLLKEEWKPTRFALIRELVAARSCNRTLNASPWTDVLADVDEAYDVQDAVGAALGWFDGQHLPGAWKSGGTSRAAPLTHAPLAPAGVRWNGTDFSDMVFHSPGIEVEIALRLGTEVTPEQASALNHVDAWSIIDAMTVAVEIVDARWQDLTATPALLRLADSQVHGALAVGDWIPYAAIDWASQRCEVKVGSAVTVEREGTHPLADPTWLLPIWLRHVTRNGHTAPRGLIVTTGSWVGVLPCSRGDQVGAAFPGIGALHLRV